MTQNIFLNFIMRNCKTYRPYGAQLTMCMQELLTCRAYGTQLRINLNVVKLMMQ
jgi:hypothetical protein